MKYYFYGLHYGEKYTLSEVIFRDYLFRVLLAGDFCRIISHDVFIIVECFGCIHLQLLYPFQDDR